MKNIHTANLPEEFAFIDRYFRPLAGQASLDLRDDCAVFLPPTGMDVVIAADAMVENVHFFSDDIPFTVGQKLLRCNLSDLAAMGATPYGYLLTVSCPKNFQKQWFEGFSFGLKADQKTFNCALLGGDTTRTTGPLVLSLTIIGYAAHGQAVKRIGAHVGDEIWITGTIGDSALGLKILQNQFNNLKISESSLAFLKHRYWVPQPRVGLNIVGVASAAMDISDGLVQDLGHIARENRLGVSVDLEKIPLSEAGQEIISLNPEELLSCLTGGDDYELLLCVPPEKRSILLENAKNACIKVAMIGQCVENHSGEVVVYNDQKQPVSFRKQGWSHF